MIAIDENSAFEKNPILASATQIISAHLGNNPVALPDVPGFIRTVFSTLVELQSDSQIEASSHNSIAMQAPTNGLPVPAVQVDASVQPDYIICLEDGKKLRMLKRYLMTQYNLTPQQYRAKWGLPEDYPMVAPVVSEQRRRAAKDSGLGRPIARKTISTRRQNAH